MPPGPRTLQFAGIHRMRWSRFLPANALSALAWALVVGLGAYLLGPSITDIGVALT